MRGGKREGAGRKKGARNRNTAEREKQIAASGLTPLAYMLQVLRDETADKSRRDWAASAAAPYIHSRMPQALVPATHMQHGGYQPSSDDKTIIDLYLNGVHAEADRS